MTGQYKFREESEPSNILLTDDNSQEWIKITNEGFWVRGIKVPQDDQEAQTVYNAFKQWLDYANLTRRY